MRHWSLQRVPQAIGVCLTTLALGGCFAVADLDRFHPGSADSGATPAADDPAKATGLELTLVNMGVHLQELIEARVIDSSNSIQSRIVVLPLDTAGAQRMTINVPNAMLPGAQYQPYRLDFFADHNHSGDYDGVGNVLTQDHAWRVEPLLDFPAGQIPHVANQVAVNFLHNTQFTDIDKWPTGAASNSATDTGLSARIRFKAASMAQYQGHLLELRLEDSRSEHTVAVYRNPEIPSEDFEAVLLGVLDVQFDYFIKIYIDANGNNQYDNPSVLGGHADLGLSIPVRSTDGSSSANGEAGATGAGARPVFGIDLEFDLGNTAYSDTEDVGPP
jgi:hypothetical protein